MYYTAVCELLALMHYTLATQQQHVDALVFTVTQVMQLSFTSESISCGKYTLFCNVSHKCHLLEY